MDARDQIVAEFDRLLAIGHDKIAGLPYAQRMIWCVVTARCEKDINSFEDIFRQALTAEQIAFLVEGLHQLDELELSSDIARAFELLRFYNDESWDKLPANVEQQILEIGKRVGDRLWDLDEKLAALLNSNQ